MSFYAVVLLWFSPPTLPPYYHQLKQRQWHPSLSISAPCRADKCSPISWGDTHHVLWPVVHLLCENDLTLIKQWSYKSFLYCYSSTVNSTITDSTVLAEKVVFNEILKPMVAKKKHLMKAFNENKT
jgi:hypothetical protein